MNKQFKVVIRGAAMMLGLAAAMSAPAAGASAAEPAASSAPAFTPPPADSIPDDAFGKMVRKGQDIFLLTPKYAG
jgi:thiosulfate dehydrogenase